MADRRDYYFRQKVTEAELDAGFDGLEAADWALAVDQDFAGVADGMGVAEAASPDLTVDVQGPGVAYSKQGERIGFSATQNVDVSEDDGGVSTAVGSSGNEKWVSLFIEFDRNLTDARTDGNGATVFHQRDESFSFSVVQGAEAASGSATKPSLDSGKILLADILRTFGDNTIDNADINTDRREDVYRLTSGTIDIIAGTPLGAITALLTALNNHVDGAANRHPAAQIDYNGGNSWRDGTSNPSATVEAQLDKIINDLASNTSPDGAVKLGVDAIGAFPDSISQGNIRSALASLLTAVNARGRLASAEAWTAKQTFSANLAAPDGGYEYSAGPLSRTEVISLLEFNQRNASTWNLSSVPTAITGGGNNEDAWFPFRLPNGATLQTVEAVVQPGAARSSGSRMEMVVRKALVDFATPSSNPSASLIAGTVEDDGTTNDQVLPLAGIGHTIDKSDGAYYVEIRHGSDANSDRIAGIRAIYDDPGPRGH